MSNANLIHISEFIEKNNLHEVKNANSFIGNAMSFDENGLWSEIIFGNVGTRERRTRFGFINLNSVMINPVMYKAILTSSEYIRNIIHEKERYVLKKDGTFTQSDIGDTGILFFLNNVNKIDFESIAKKDKKDTGRFIAKNKDLIFIKQYLIMPAGIRDFSTQKKDTKQFSSEINEIYERIITINNQLRDQSDDDLRQILVITLQKMMNSAFEWIRTRFSGKQGIMRGTLLKRTLDYSARIVAVSDSKMPLGKIGLPWHTVMVLFEPFFVHHVFKDQDLVQKLQDYMKLDKFDSHDLHLFFMQCVKNPKHIDSEIRDQLISLGESIVNGKQVLLKRDPVVSRNSYYAAEVVIIKDGHGAVTNPLTCGPQGLDYDGDCIAIMPLFTDEANEQAKNMNPMYSKTAWINPTTGQTHYGLTLDAVSTIYSATRH